MTLSTLEPGLSRPEVRDWPDQVQTVRRTPPAAVSGSWIGPTFVAGWPVIGPLVLLMAATILFRSTALDRTISAWFFDVRTQSWPWFYNSVCTLFYRGGVYPAFGLAFGGVAMGLWGLMAPRRRAPYLRAGTFLWVAFLLGPGIIVNASLKNHWGRPRPHQIEQFGGPHRFVPVLTRSWQQPNNASFPSGHAAVAFFLIAPAFLVDRRRPRLARTLLATGLVFGAAMSAVRVIQGGHFASDVVWSAAIVYFTCVACARVILQPRYELLSAAVGHGSREGH